MGGYMSMFYNSIFDVFKKMNMLMVGLDSAEKQQFYIN